MKRGLNQLKPGRDGDERLQRSAHTLQRSSSGTAAVGASAAAASGQSMQTLPVIRLVRTDGQTGRVRVADEEEGRRLRANDALRCAAVRLVSSESSLPPPTPHPPSAMQCAINGCSCGCSCESLSHSHCHGDCTSTHCRAPRLRLCLSVVSRLSLSVCLIEQPRRAWPTASRIRITTAPIAMWMWIAAIAVILPAAIVREHTRRDR